MGDPSSDVELLRAWQGGDEAAGNALLLRHFQPVYRFFAGKLDDHVEDLVQQTFLTCLEKHGGYRGEGSFRAYLLGIARFRLLNYLRDRKPKDAPLSAIAERSLFEMSASPSRMVAKRDEQRVLLAALRRLPLDLQITLELHYWEELRTAEIAAVLDIPQGTVKTRLVRARRLLEVAVAELAEADALRDATLANLDEWAASLRERVAEGKKII